MPIKDKCSRVNFERFLIVKTAMRALTSDVAGALKPTAIRDAL